jgi:cytochrome P450
MFPPSNGEPRMTAHTLAARPLRFRPAAPEPVERDLNLWELMTTGAARNLLTAVPREAYEVPYRRARTLNFVFHGVSDPEAIKHVFVDNAANYRRPRLVQRILRPAIGEGLFTAEGDAWRSQRRLMTPAFLPSAVAAFAPLFAEAAAHAARRLAGRADGEVADMAEEATRATLAVIDGALFSGESDMPFDETSTLVRAFMGGSTEITFGLMLGQAVLDMAPRQRLARRARRVLTSRMAAFIHRRAEEPDPPEDFVSRLYRAFLAEHPRDEAMQLTLDNALTFFVAGHETTANGLAWALYLLSGDAQAQGWAREEAQAAWAAAGDDANAVLPRLPYLKMVWDETLRLYPPVHRIDREALGDDEVCGHRVRKGETITVWPWILHRHKALWREPELFNPENFDPEAKAGRPRFQYLPFGAGSRMCIGMGFAEAEALILLSKWVAQYSFAPAPGHAVQPHADFSLRPQGGLPLIVRRLGL